MLLKSMCVQLRLAKLAHLFLLCQRLFFINDCRTATSVVKRHYDRWQLNLNLRYRKNVIEKEGSGDVDGLPSVQSHICAAARQLEILGTGTADSYQFEPTSVL